MRDCTGLEPARKLSSGTGSVMFHTRLGRRPTISLLYCQNTEHHLLNSFTAGSFPVTADESLQCDFDGYQQKKKVNKFAVISSYVGPAS